jgi:hypothetical protein
MSSYAAEEQQEANATPKATVTQRRGSWKAVKSFLKDTKRRTVQRVVQISQKGGHNKQFTGEELEYQIDKKMFAEFHEAVLETRKDLASVQISVSKVSRTFSALTNSLSKFPRVESESLEQEKNVKLQSRFAKCQVGCEELVATLEIVRAEFKNKLEYLQHIKLQGRKRDQYEIDLLSYERRLKLFQGKNDDKNVEKFQGKRERAFDLFTETDKELRKKYAEVQAHRGEFTKKTLQSVFTSTAQYFSDLSEACKESIPSTSLRSSTYEHKETSANFHNTLKEKMGGDGGKAKSKVLLCDSKITNPPARTQPGLHEADDPEGGKHQSVMKAGTAIVATHDFYPEEEDELAFSKGDTMVAIEVVGPGWLFARNLNGDTGLIPDNYVIIKNQ